MLRSGRLLNTDLLINMNLSQRIKKISSHDIAKSSLIVFVGTMTANVASYVYHLLMGRMLGPSGYGELSSLLSILYIFTVPLIVGQTVLVKFISAIKAQGSLGQAKSLFIKISTLVALAGIIILPGIYILSPVITAFLHLPSTGLFVQVYVLFIIALLSVIASSMLQGYQLFTWFSILSALAVIVKVILSVPFVRFGVSGVLWASVLSAVLLYLIYYIPIQFILRVKKSPSLISKKEAFLYTIPTFLTILGITSLYSTDVILVRHFFSANNAGLYSALAILGKIIFYASSAVSLVMFPIISEKTVKKQNTKHLVFVSLLGVAGVSLFLCIFYFVFPSFIVSMLFGKAYVSAHTLLGIFGVFLSLFSLGYIIVNMCLAIGKTGIWFITMACAILQIAGISIFHTSILVVLYVNIVVSALLVIGGLVYYLGATNEKV